jgi:hypothetical protein
MGELFKLLPIDWQALSAIGTFAAVVVALLPIWSERRRNRAQARSLRFRLCSKLTVLRPSLSAVVNSGVATTPAAVLSQDEFREAVGSVEAMMQESSALAPPEQDQLGVVLANLEMAARLYGTSELHPDSASNTLSLIDRAVAIMSKHGLLSQW